MWCCVGETLLRTSHSMTQCKKYLLKSLKETRGGDMDPTKALDYDQALKASFQDMPGAQQLAPLYTTYEDDDPDADEEVRAE